MEGEGEEGGGGRKREILIFCAILWSISSQSLIQLRVCYLDVHAQLILPSGGMSPTHGVRQPDCTHQGVKLTAVATHLGGMSDRHSLTGHTPDRSLFSCTSCEHQDPTGTP